MKKTISILLIVAMMLASMLAIIPVSAAPKGDKISTAAEFAAMAADGEYYLANDIIISASYKEAFKGKLDGNGKTITVYSATPIFEKIEGAEISNLNIVMEFETGKPNGTFGALAKTAYGNFEAINADISFVFTEKPAVSHLGGLFGEVNGETDMYEIIVKGAIEYQVDNLEADNATIGIGGIIGSMNTDKSVTIESLTNYADVKSGLQRAGVGGIVGAVNGKTQLVIEDTLNYGAVDSCRGTGHRGTGGFIGVVNGNSVKEQSVEIVTSRNYGEVMSHGSGNEADNMKGGFIGRAYGPANLTVEDCVNSGVITSVGTGWASAAGIVGCIETYNYDWSKNYEATLVVKNCVNIAEVKGGAYNGGIVGSMLQGNSPDVELTIEDCANYGRVSSGQAGGIFGKLGDGGANALVITGCYNAGDAGSAMVAQIELRWSKCHEDDINYEIIGKEVIDGEWKFKAAYPAPVIKNCVNEGSVTNFVGGLTCNTDIGATAVKGIVTNCVMGSASNPSASYTVTAPADAAAVTAEVKATVAGNPSALDAILAEYIGLVADDYTEGWDAFEPVYTAALADANKATPQAKLDAHILELEAKSADLVLAEVDVAPLIAAIEAAEAILADEAMYTPLSWGIFTSALENAETVLEETDALNSTVKPSDVKTATAKLQTAQDALEELATAEQEELAAAIAKYSDETKYGTATYVSTSVDALKAAIAASEALVDDVNATKSGVNAAIEAIVDAAEALVPKADTAALRAKATELSNTYKLNDYTAKSHNDLNSVIRRANDAVTANDMSQADVDSLMKQLDNAVSKLVKRGNLDAIEAVLEPYGDVFDEDVLDALKYNYTNESFKAFSDVIKEVSSAKQEDKKPNFSEADAEKLLEKVNSAIAGLVAFATYGDIDAKIAEVNALDKNAYTAESWQVLQDAIAAANALKSNRNTTQPEADAALAAINAAVEALAQVSTDGEGVEEEKKGCKSAIGATVVVMTATLGLGATVVLKKKD